MRQTLGGRTASRAPKEALVEELGRHLDPATADGLLRAAGRGDEAAFGVLFDWTAPVILGCVRNVLHRPGDAERVTEDVYVHLWRGASRFQPGRGSAHQRLLDLTRCELLRWHQRRARACQASPTLREPG